MEPLSLLSFLLERQRCFFTELVQQNASRLDVEGERGNDEKGWGGGRGRGRGRRRKTRARGGGGGIDPLLRV